MYRITVLTSSDASKRSEALKTEVKNTFGATANTSNHIIQYGAMSSNMFNVTVRRHSANYPTVFIDGMSVISNADADFLLGVAKYDPMYLTLQEVSDYILNNDTFEIRYLDVPETITE